MNQTSKPGGGFFQAARAQALKSRVSVDLTGGKAPCLTLRARAPDHGQFEVRREDAADRWAEGLSLSRTIGKADPVFGGRYHIDSDDEAFASAFFSAADKRAAVETLFAAGCSSLEWGDGDVTASWDDFRPQDNDAAFVGAVAAALRALTRNVPPAAAASLPPDGWTEKSFNARAYLAIFVGAIVSFLTTMSSSDLPGQPRVDGWPSLLGRPVDFSELFRASLRVSAPLAALFIFACLWSIRGKSWFMKAARNLLLAAALLFPSVGYVVYARINSSLDGSPAAHFVLPVVSKRRIESQIRNKKSGIRYVYSHYVCIAAWRPGPNPCFEASVDPATYARIQEGATRAHLTTRSGRLGHEWIASLDFADSFDGASAHAELCDEAKSTAQQFLDWDSQGERNHKRSTKMDRITYWGREGGDLPGWDVMYVAKSAEIIGCREAGSVARFSIQTATVGDWRLNGDAGQRAVFIPAKEKERFELVLLKDAGKWKVDYKSVYPPHISISTAQKTFQDFLSGPMVKK